MQWCCNIVIKLLADPFGLCLFLKAIMPYTAEQQLVNTDLFCFFVKLALCRASNRFACYLQIDN